MATKRYIANADTTITNAYQADLTTRGTGSNMGLSDSLEVFSIYGQTISGSNATKTTELSRILVNFPVTEIATDRTNEDIPASGSVSFYLRMFNAEHPFTVPRNFTLSASAITSDWEEGHGLDMEGYKDLTYDDTGANWMNANGDLAAATLVDAIDISGHAAGDKFTMTVPVAAGGDNVARTFLFDTTDNINGNSAAQTFGFSRQTVDDDTELRNAVINAINGDADDNAKFGDADIGAGSTLAAGTLGLTAAAGTGNSKITLTMDDKGTGGNVANVLAAVTNFAEGSKLLITTFVGGSGHWTRPGGDFDVSGEPSSFQQTFTNGIEDLEMDITTLVEQWLNSSGNVLSDKSSARYGLGIYLTSSQEAYYIDTDIVDGDYGILKNPTGSTNSYYTKKFFARGSEYFFKRPIIEARWDSSKKDNRGNFYLSSSLASTENLNTLYLYNYVRGQLKNIPDLGGPGSDHVDSDETLSDVTRTKLDVRIFSGSLPADAITLPIGGGVTVDGAYVVTASYVSTGIYSASFAYTGSETTIYDVWSTGSGGMRGTGASYKEFHTGSAITVKNINSYEYNPNDTYVSSITNLKSIYSNKETARFRLFARKKDWTPTIYTKATTEANAEIVEDAYYKVFRVYDDLNVVEYGTGSLNHTRASYDISGSYFDLDMSMLEADYMYGIKIIYYLNGKYAEQPEIFKFRVEKDLTDIE